MTAGWVRGVRLGVDVGSVRVGVAMCDPDGILATPVATVPRDQSFLPPAESGQAERGPAESGAANADAGSTGSAGSRRISRHK